MNAQDYLARIGFKGEVRHDVATLAALVKAHRYSVPYETLDLWHRRDFTLELPAIYDKIVTRRRGGYCFELNGLFAWLLKELGFNVREYFGRWLLGEDEKVPMRRHRVVCVALPDGPNRIVDVGIGLPFLFSPLDFVFGLPQSRDGKIYRVVRDPTLTCVVEVKAPDAWKGLFSFDTAPQLPQDFEYASWWCRTHPSSSFLEKVWIYRPSPDGGSKAVSLEKDPKTGVATFVFAVLSPGGVLVRTPLADEKALGETLRAQFGIVE